MRSPSQKISLLGGLDGEKQLKEKTVCLPFSQKFKMANIYLSIYLSIRNSFASDFLPARLLAGPGQ